MQITISGIRERGKSEVARLIAEALKQDGFMKVVVLNAEKNDPPAIKTGPIVVSVTK